MTNTGGGQAVGMHGTGGIGKTVRAAFPEGIFWLTISQTPDLLSRQHQLAQALTGQPQVLRDLQHGRGVLEDLLRDRAVLLILDHAWSADHAVLESLNRLRESPDYELCQLSERKPGVLEDLAAERAKLLEKESTELEQQANRLGEEIKELSGETPGRIS